MIDIAFDRLRRLGLTPALANAATALADAPGLQLLRLTEINRETVRLQDGDDELTARPLPRLVRSLTDAATELAVGDWVLAEVDPHGQTWVRARVPPSSHLGRRDADGRRHAIVSNVDTALLVMGLDDDFNPSRLERYLAVVQAHEGVVPVVVLSKADMVAGMPGRLADCLEALRGRVPARIDLFAVDGTDPYARRQLQAYLGAGQTLVMLGSSGAGKSTLTNTLVGHAVQDTGAVRAHDSRGKHTTTSRSLHCLAGGACVIDTPGLRALRPDVDEAVLRTAFEDVDALAARCRFRDCGHHDEPGCAVREGVPAERLRNFHKLLREARRDKMNALERQQQIALWKARGREGRDRLRQKREGT